MVISSTWTIEVKFTGQFYSYVNTHTHRATVAVEINVPILAIVLLNWGEETLPNIFHIIAQFKNIQRVQIAANRQITTLSTTKRSNISLHFCLFLPRTAALTHTKILACHFLLCMHENLEQLKKRTASIRLHFFLVFFFILLPFFVRHSLCGWYRV